MKPKWEGNLIEECSEKISEKAYRLRIARVAEILYKELSQLELDPKTSSEIEPKKIRVNSDQVA